jgi:hypothetical protein
MIVAQLGLVLKVARLRRALQRAGLTARFRNHYNIDLISDGKEQSVTEEGTFLKETTSKRKDHARWH